MFYLIKKSAVYYSRHFKSLVIKKEIVKTSANILATKKKKKKCRLAHYHKLVKEGKQN